MAVKPMPRRRTQQGLGLSLRDILCLTVGVVTMAVAISSQMQIVRIFQPSTVSTSTVETKTAAVAAATTPEKSGLRNAEGRVSEEEEEDTMEENEKEETQKDGEKEKQATTASAVMISSDSREARFKRYKERYKYMEPVAREGKNETCLSGPPYANFFALGRQDRSISNEDNIIYNLYMTDREGPEFYYVEMGAFDGKTESNSRFFDDCLGWSGVLIEANPRKYNKLVANRPHTHRFSYAPSCTAKQEAQDHTIPFHVSEFTSAAQSDVLPDNPNFGSVDVPCGPLTPVLLDVLPERAKVVHFFSLDVEGAEPLILKQLDSNQITVEVFIIESHNSHCKEDCPSRDEVRQIMKDRGYEMQRVGTVPRSDVYLHPTVAKQLAEKTEGS